MAQYDSLVDKSVSKLVVSALPSSADRWRISSINIEQTSLYLPSEKRISTAVTQIS